MDITLHTAYLTQLVSPTEICRALKTEDSSLCLLRIKGLKGLLGGRPGHGTPQNTGVTKQRPQADRAHTGAHHLSSWQHPPPRDAQEPPVLLVQLLDVLGLLRREQPGAALRGHELDVQPL